MNVMQIPPKLIFSLIFLLAIEFSAFGQLPPALNNGMEYKIADDNRTRKYIAPVKIFWKSTENEALIKNENHLLGQPIGQAILTSNQDFLVMKSTATEKPGILLDFGVNLHGGIQLVTGMIGSKDPVRVRIRLGESVTEAMSAIDTLQGATNDHAMRDFIVALPWLGKLEIGHSGFRYARIDLVDPNK